MSEVAIESEIVGSAAINPGKVVVGVQTFQSAPVTGAGDQIWTIGGIAANAPSTATDVIVALTGFQMSYTDGDHHVQTVKVIVNQIPGGLPTSISGVLRLQDKHDDTSFSGYVTIIAIYLGPYWA